MKMRTKATLCGILFFYQFVLTGCAATKARPMNIDQVRRAVDAGNATWILAMRMQDPELLASVFDPTGAMLGSTGKVYRGREGVREAMGGLMQTWGSTETTIDTDNLWVVDCIAFETGRYSYTYKPKGKEKSVSTGRYVVRWKHQPDGSWKIETDLGLPDK